MSSVLNFNRPSRLPVYDGAILSEFLTAWRAETDSDFPFDQFPNDLAILAPIETPFLTQAVSLPISGGHELFNDGWGRIVRRRPGAYFEETVARTVDPRDLERLPFDSPRDSQRFEAVKRDARDQSDLGKALFFKMGGPFIRTSFLCGECELLTDLVSDPQFAGRVVARVAEHLLEVVLEAMRCVSVPNLGVWIFDDMCSLHAPIFSPRTFEQVFMPIYADCIERLKQAGARWVMLHCDGNIKPFLDMLLEVGIDGINPAEPAAGLDAVELIDKYRGRLRIIGGVCNTHILPSNDLERIRTHVVRIIDAARDGGIVIGTHSISGEISPRAYVLYRSLVRDGQESEK